MNIPAPLQRVIDKSNELQKEIEGAGKEAIVELFQQFFVKHPEVTGLRWTQYTPHFNDGDACVFSVNGLEARFQEGVTVAVAKLGGYPEEDVVSDGDQFVQSWDFKKAHPAVDASIGEIEAVLNHVEDVLEKVFGDGVQVSVSSDGEVEIEEYDHD